MKKTLPYHGQNNQTTNETISMVAKYLKENKLLCVPLDEGKGSCIMKKATYQSKTNKVLECPQFLRIETTNPQN